MFSQKYTKQQSIVDTTIWQKACF